MLIWASNSSSLSFTQLLPSALLQFFLPFFSFPLIHTLCLSCSFATFPLPLKGRLLLYTAEGASVVMGTLQRRFLPSVQGTEEFVLIFSFLLPTFSTFLQPSNLFFAQWQLLKSSEMITVLTVHVHKEQTGITRAFLPLQNGICCTCPDFCCHCSISSVARGRKQPLSRDGAEMLHASAATDCWTVTGLNIIFWQSKHLVEIALWTQSFGISWQARAFPGTTEVLSICVSLLKESRSGLCALAVLQNGLSWVLCSFTCFIFPQTWVTLLSQWVICFLPSLLHLPVAVFWENTWQIIII